MPHSDRTLVWTKRTLFRMVAKDFQKMIRVESADAHGICTCVTCGTKRHWKDLDAGHYLPGNSVKFVEINCHCQCVRCNQHLSGNLIKYAKFMLDEYGDKAVADLELARNQTRSYTRDQLLDMRLTFRERWKYLVRGKTVCPNCSSTYVYRDDAHSPIECFDCGHMFTTT